MKSKTKYELSKAEIDTIFKMAKLPPVVDFKPLGAGMYNAVYKVNTNERAYVIKIAPRPDVAVMTYERDLLSSEVRWYKTMAEQTTINTPQIYSVDTSKSIIPSEYFIMDYVDGNTLNLLKLSKDERALADESLCKNIAELHKIKSDKFGYVQNGLYDTWYDAIKSFIQNCLADLGAVSKRSRRGKKLLSYLENNKDLLLKVEGCLVNYDAWDLNIVGRRTDGGLDFTWIDPERGFFGDPIFDFICVGFTKMTMQQKQNYLDLYNKYADKKVVADSSTELRFAFALGYMALIQETEKFYRYIPLNYGWWIDVVSSSMCYKACFKLLKKYGK